MMLVAAVTACGWNRWLWRGTPLQAVELGRAQLCADGQDGVRVRWFDTAADVRLWQQQTGVDLRLKTIPERGRYVLIELGQRNTGGYGIAVSREARLLGTTLYLYATFFAPAPGAMTVQMITSPCVLVHLPEADFAAIEVYDQEGRLRASANRPG